MNEQTVDHRRYAPEKFVAVVISAAALAFSVGSAILAVYDRLLDDISALHRRVDVTDSKVEAYYRERAPYIDRLIELERKYGVAVDRLGTLGERLARCERDPGT